MRKLTKVQLTTLERLGQGLTLEGVTWVAGREGKETFVWRSAKGTPGIFHRNPRRQTVLVLIGLDFVEKTQEHWWGRVYAITDKGRDYLARRGDVTD